jgi:hypothetical protein
VWAGGLFQPILNALFNRRRCETSNYGAYGSVDYEPGAYGYGAGGWDGYPLMYTLVPGTYGWGGFGSYGYAPAYGSAPGYGAYGCGYAAHHPRAFGGYAIAAHRSYHRYASRLHREAPRGEAICQSSRIMEPLDPRATR